MEERVRRGVLVSGLDATLVKKLSIWHPAKARRRSCKIMAIKMKLPPLKEENMEEKEEPEAPLEGESALFRLTDAALKKLIRSASESAMLLMTRLMPCCLRMMSSLTRSKTSWRNLPRQA